MTETNADTERDWYWSANAERFGAGPYTSRAAAAEAAVAELDPGDKFWTGCRRDLSGADFSVGSGEVLELVGLQAYELAGEVAEEWPSFEDAPDLEKALNGVLQAWIDEHDPPSFWIVDEMEEHVAPEPVTP